LDQTISIPPEHTFIAAHRGVVALNEGGAIKFYNIDNTEADDSYTSSNLILSTVIPANSPIDS
jgi:hypothetical protein